MIVALAIAAQCMLPARPVLAQVEVGGVTATLTPNAVHLGEHHATGCDTLPAPRPIAIAAWRGTLAIGFRDGGVWTWDGTTFTPVLGLPASGVRALAATGDTLWVGTAGDGLWSVGAAPRRFAHATLGRAPITALHADARGLLVGVDPRGLWRVTGTAATRVSKRQLVGCFVGGAPRPPGPACTPTGGDAPFHVVALVEHGGRVVAGTFDDGIWEHTPTGWIRLPDAPRMIDALLVDGEHLYAATATGLYRRTRAGFERLELGLPSSHINDLVKAGDTLWLATSRGLAAWDGRSVRTIDTGSARVVYAITVASDGAVWAGTIAGALRFGTDGVTRFDRARGTLLGDWVTALLPDEDGAVLAGSYDAGVVRLAPDGTSRPVPPFDGALWINPHGLSRHGTTIFAATLGQGLRLSAGTAPALPDPDVTSVLRVGTTTWVGTRGGVARIR